MILVGETDNWDDFVNRTCVVCASCRHGSPRGVRWVELSSLQNILGGVEIFWVEHFVAPSMNGFD